MKFTRISLCIVIIAVMLLNLCGCSTNLKSGNLMKNITPNDVVATENLEDGVTAINNFSVEFLINCQEEGKNSLVSPLSAIYALGMAANGASGETLSQMENTLGMKKGDLNLYLYSLMANLKKDPGSKFNLANSVWFTDSKRFTVNKEFLQTNADYYGADIYREPFNNSTVKKINKWVSEETNGMIKDIVNDSLINDNAVMCLINALCFEAEWEETYTEDDVEEGTFTNADSKKSKCDFMYGEESYFIEDENATGFVKPYLNSNFEFVAILPNKDVTVDEYLSSLNGEKLTKMLNSSRGAIVKTSIPKFEAEFEFSISKQLEKMGMHLAFDPAKADFSGLGTSKTGNIYINEAKQKIYISVAEKGTKAGAATVISFFDSLIPYEETKEVYLNRPFVYMIVDTVTDVPLFMGVMNNI